MFFLIMGGCGMPTLKKYKSKRDFSKTNEPRGAVKKRNKGETGLFVIQQHAARAMHYDVRLEIDGVLVSWAVPKGPSMNPADKRLAIQTDDHPMEYAKFEGIIPEGNYGAGPVIVWDRGTYRSIKEKDGVVIPMKTCLKNRHIEIEFHGKKLQGAFALIGTGDAVGEKSHWLLIKMHDEYADARRNIIKSHPESVKSGLTIKDLKKKLKK